MTTRGNPRENRHPLRLHRRATVGAASFAIAFVASTLARPSSASTVSVTVLASTVSIPATASIFFTRNAPALFIHLRDDVQQALKHTTSMGSHELAGTTRRRPLFASRGLASSAPATTVLVAEPAKAVHGLRTWPRAVQGRHPYMAESRTEPAKAVHGRQSRTWAYMAASRTFGLRSAVRPVCTRPRSHVPDLASPDQPMVRLTSLRNPLPLSLPRGVHRAARCGARNRSQ